MTVIIFDSQSTIRLILGAVDPTEFGVSTSDREGIKVTILQAWGTPWIRLMPGTHSIQCIAWITYKLYGAVNITTI